jgi:23S rRNA (guanine2445-N2)-methyltransferase / 23S rRNA (guanine2069-N7)-methyltransferase
VPATDAEALYAGVRTIKWTEYLDANHTFAIDASGTSPTLRHTHFTALRIKDAVVDTLRDASGARPDVNVESPDVKIIAHLSRDKCDVSLDVSGEALFKRGYRKDPAKASLKETLAAAMLIASGYDGQRPLIDPMCGAGTIALEAALIAHRCAPGLNRTFGVEKWPICDATMRSTLQKLREEARAQIRKEAPIIRASDRDQECVQATGRNAANLNIPGVHKPIELAVADARELDAISPPGYVVSNPPYGQRLEGGGRKQLKSFFWQLGQRWRTLHGHRVALLAGGPELESAFGMRPIARRPMFNGPIECQLLQYDVD